MKVQIVLQYRLEVSSKSDLSSNYEWNDARTDTWLLEIDLYFLICINFDLWSIFLSTKKYQIWIEDQDSDFVRALQTPYISND